MALNGGGLEHYYRKIMTLSLWALFCLPRKACTSCPADAWRRFKRLGRLQRPRVPEKQDPFSLAQTSFQPHNPKGFRQILPRQIKTLRRSSAIIVLPALLLFNLPPFPGNPPLFHSACARKHPNSPHDTIYGISKHQPHLPISNTYRQK